MKILDFFGKKPDVKVEAKKEFEPSFSASGTYNVLYSKSFNGEKTPGELGSPTEYTLDYYGLRLRAWKSYLDNENTQKIINRYTTWVIGAGLKLQSEPIVDLLKEEGINVDFEKTSKKIDNYFKVWSKSSSVDYCGIDNLSRIANTVHRNTLIGGDTLVVLRLVDGKVKVSQYDGAEVQTPSIVSTLSEITKRQSKIYNGVEYNSKGQIIAYYVRLDVGKYKRIKAKNNGLDVAFLVSGLKYRDSDKRGIPKVASILETLEKLDRYKEATVGSAEERAKIPYSIEHSDNSTGENPFQQSMAKAYDIDSDLTPSIISDSELASNVAATTGKQVVNMPQGSTLKALESKAELQFNDFYSANIDSIASTIGMPPEVALSKYDSNFSASRAALKDWEHTLLVERTNFNFQFYQKIYNFWLYVNTLQNKINIPGYITAVQTGDELVIESWQNARFIGATVPHIDPVKEVNAERLKLGKLAENLPLTTLEQATENLNSGDYSSNLLKYQKELIDSSELLTTEENTQNEI
tara:strand:+ start:464 stop:2032 length:1569 start_codon:yes stop_codon:yes gene_type:complete